MPAAVKLRTDFTARELRHRATVTKNAIQSRRLLALAAVLDGMSRAQAARIGGRDRETVIRSHSERRATEGMKLGYLLTDLGFFHRGHRAVDDCHALLRLLATPLRISGQLALSALLEKARRSTVRLWAQGSPFEAKAILKARSYRWSARRRSWYIDLDEAQIEIERTFLSEQVFGRPVPGLPADRFTARDRFSA